MGPSSLAYNDVTVLYICYHAIGTSLTFYDVMSCCACHYSMGTTPTTPTISQSSTLAIMPVGLPSLTMTSLSSIFAAMPVESPPTYYVTVLHIHHSTMRISTPDELHDFWAKISEQKKERLKKWSSYYEDFLLEFIS